LIRFGVKNSRNESEDPRKEVRQQALSGSDKEQLILATVEIADDRATVGQARVLQSRTAKVSADNYSWLWAESNRGQHLSDGI
jgi:hypothetical protein